MTACLLIQALQADHLDLARLSADLPVFLRQSHAERDLAALGEQLARQPAGVWQL